MTIDIQESVLAKINLEHTSSHLCIYEPILYDTDGNALEVEMPPCVPTGYNSVRKTNGIEMCNGR